MANPSRGFRMPLVAAAVVGLLLPVSPHSSQAWGWPRGAPLTQAGGGQPLTFEPNRGQASPDVLFLAHSRQGTLSFTASGVRVPLGHGLAVAGQALAPIGSAEPRTVGLRFVDAASTVSVQAAQQLPARINYFIGRDPSRWQVGLPTYGRITYVGLYQGINLSYQDDRGGLKGTYEVAVGADPSRIQWHYGDIRDLSVRSDGDLHIVSRVTTTGEAGGADRTVDLIERAPVAWQDIDGYRQAVPVSYHIGRDGTVSFRVGTYDRSRPLVIDPTLDYSTVLGLGQIEGGGSSVGYTGSHATGTAVDATGNAYIVGYTGAGFPGTSGVSNFKSGQRGQNLVADAPWVFVSKMRLAAGGASDLLYSTFLGGSGLDYGAGIALDSRGNNAFITGMTSSEDFPVAPAAPGHPLQVSKPVTYGGSGYVGFMAKLDAATGKLLYSTYLPGDGDATTRIGVVSRGRGIAVDASGAAYVGGEMHVGTLPASPGAFQTSPSEGFLIKIDPNGEGAADLGYATYVGNGKRVGVGVGAVAVDGTGSTYLTGATDSTFPVTPGSLSSGSTASGGETTSEPFVAKLRLDGHGRNDLVYGTLVGHDGVGQGIAVDDAGGIYGLFWVSRG